MANSFIKRKSYDPIRGNQPRADSTYFKIKLMMMAALLGLLIYAMYRLNSGGIGLPHAP